MSVLLIPIAPLSRTKSRLRDCFPKELLKQAQEQISEMQGFPGFEI